MCSCLIRIDRLRETTEGKTEPEWNRPIRTIFRHLATSSDADLMKDPMCHSHGRPAKTADNHFARDARLTPRQITNTVTCSIRHSFAATASHAA